MLTLMVLALVSGLVLGGENCSYLSIVQELGLTSDNRDLLTVSRPVRNHKEPLEVSLKFMLEALLDVREADQTFISYTTIDISWKNELLQWPQLQNCSIERITVPKQLLWQPDLTIYEEVEKDSSSSESFLVITYNFVYVSIHMKKDQVIKSMCKMDVFKFPFDTQRCNLTFKSFIHTSEEIKLVTLGSGEDLTEKIQDSINTQYEWLFQRLQITENSRCCALGNQQDQVVYTITMRRRSLLYVVNFILPVLFFLSLDFASFLMTDRGGDKLSFKITILLAVTVLQLLLNEILPSSSDNIPLIAIFCIGVFCLMKVSLLETILVMYLRQQDSKCTRDCSKTTAPGVRCWSFFKRLQENSSDELQPEQSKDQQENLGPVAGGSDVEQLLMEVKEVLSEVAVRSREVKEVLSEVTGRSREEEEEVGFWSRRIHLINRVFLLLYSSCTALFLGLIFSFWTN